MTTQGGKPQGDSAIAGGFQRRFERTDPLAARLAVGQGLLAGLGLLLAIALAAPVSAGEWTGFVGLEWRGFASDGSAPGQERHEGSLTLEPEFFHEWEEGRQRIVVRPFARLDSADDERTHVDLREFYWQRIGDGWDLEIGVRKVFWGVAESLHLVDILNQTDLVEDLDGEDKLGQPMIRVRLSRSWGLLEVFLLPGFRERTFPGADGRLRTPIPVDTDRPLYESSAEDGHVDGAIRWSHVLGDVDLGLSYFRGTSREPNLVFGLEPSGPTLRPFYPQIDQFGLDLQATRGAWLFKLEAISRWSDLEDHLAAVGGFEYTFFDVAGRGPDIGVLAELLWDERGATAITPFAEDLFIGSRVALNDVQSTEFLLGGVLDLDNGSLFLNLEASRRLGSRWELELRGRAFTDVDPTDRLFPLENDDYLQLGLRFYF